MFSCLDSLCTYEALMGKKMILAISKKKKKNNDTKIISFKILDDEMKIFGLGLDCAKNG